MHTYLSVICRDTPGKPNFTVRLRRLHKFTGSHFTHTVCILNRLYAYACNERFERLDRSVPLGARRDSSFAADYCGHDRLVWLCAVRI